MRAATFAAFVLGVFVLQWQSTLPSVASGVLMVGAAIATLVIAARVRRRGVLDIGARAATFAAIVAIGFAYAAGYASWRMSDELSFEDEGRDVAITGTIATLPVRLERGVRFEFVVESVTTPGIWVPEKNTARLVQRWHASAAG